jgi:hypothetical protein
MTVEIEYFDILSFVFTFMCSVLIRFSSSYRSFVSSHPLGDVVVNLPLTSAMNITVRISLDNATVAHLNSFANVSALMPSPNASHPYTLLTRAKLNQLDARIGAHARVDGDALGQEVIVAVTLADIEVSVWIIIILFFFIEIGFTFLCVLCFPSLSAC